MGILKAVGDYGKGAINDPSDVITVQELLTAAASALGRPEYDPKGIDGKIAGVASKSNTVKAIKAFQKRWMNFPDGIISPGYRTIIDLVKFAGKLPVPDPRDVMKEIVNGVDDFIKGFGPGVTGPCFPYKTLAWQGYHKGSGARWFGARRKSWDKNRKKFLGYRKHAGCDLIMQPGKPVFAVDEGVVKIAYRDFYLGTKQIQIEHPHFLVRYGEVNDKRAPGVAEGKEVSKGQLIGYVGHLKMLHFELYENTMNGHLTDYSQKPNMNFEDAPYMRRRDLMNPYEFLKSWEKNLPDGH